MLVRAWFWWPRLTEDVTKYVTGCLTCQTCRPRNYVNRAPVQLLPPPPSKFHRVGLDFVWGLNPDRFQQTWVLTVDYWSITGSRPGWRCTREWNADFLYPWKGRTETAVVPVDCLAKDAGPAPVLEARMGPNETADETLNQVRAVIPSLPVGRP